jgi:signal transduction histidine kinase
VLVGDDVTATHSADRSRPRLDAAVALTAAMTVAGAVAAWQVSGLGAPAGAPFTIPLLAIIAGVVVLERYAVHLYFRGEAHTFTLGELAIVLGLFFAAPLALVVGRVIGVLLLVTVIDRQRPVKAAFNTAVGFLETSLAALLWVSLGGLDAGLSTATIGLAMIVAISAGTVSVAMVWSVIALVSRELDLGELRSSLSVAIPISAANATLAGCIVVVAWLRPELAWLPLIPMVVLLVAYRAYVAERRHRDGLSFLYEVAREVNSAPDAGTGLRQLLSEVRDYLRARRIDLFLIPDGSQTTTVLTLHEAETIDDRIPTVELPLAVDGAVRGEPVEIHGKQAIAVASLGRGGTLVIQVTEPVADVDGFDRVAGDVLGSIANLATTLVDRADLDEMKTAFLSAVSHELRTPLAVVMGTATTLRHRGAQLRPDQTELLTERLEAHAQRLDKLLTDLLDIDRLARGVVEPRRREVDVSLMTSRLLDALEVTTHPVKLYGAGVRAYVDGPQVERIVENLVRNAVKYTPAGTPIEVSLQRLPEGVRIVVEDRGPGVPDTAKGSVLEPFVRLDADHPSPGTGIGLSLVRRFAQLHGGDIEVRDRPGGGATFSVLLVDDRPELAHPLEPGTAPDASVVTLRPIA